MRGIRKVGRREWGTKRGKEGMGEGEEGQIGTEEEERKGKTAPHVVRAPISADGGAGDAAGRLSADDLCVA